jgi:hypothetical protein
MRYRSLFTIAFDNSQRLKSKTYYFAYRGVEFKLVQDNPQRRADHLLTIVEDDAECLRAFRAAAEFMSALAWENNSRIALWENGYRSWPAPRTLRQARPWSYTFPRISFSGLMTGNDISRLPLIETEDQRAALALFREARASNNEYLRFLFYWQVLQVRSPSAAIGFVDKAFRRQRAKLRLHEDDLAEIPLNGRTLGKYLSDDCRDAIAHLRRRQGSRSIDLDDPLDRRRLTHSARIVESFAELFISEQLRLNKAVFLRQQKRGSIPLYVEV